MITRPRGRFFSLLAWGFLVGGVAVLASFSDLAPGEHLVTRGLPIALLFVLGGGVFGMSHPEGRDWLGAVLLGWVPAVVGILTLIREPGAGTALAAVVLVSAPAALSAGGAWLGATLFRARPRV